MNCFNWIFNIRLNAEKHDFKEKSIKGAEKW
jgi:hypothetical protein